MMVECPVCQWENEVDQTVCVCCEANIAQSQMIAELTARLVRLEGVVSRLGGETVDVMGDIPMPSEPKSQPIPQPRPQKISKADLQQKWREAEREQPRQNAQQSESDSRITGADFLSSEFWLDKAGIGLTILALALLFRLAAERGWVTPAVRVGIGLLIATGLMGGGFWMVERRPKLSKVLLGGGLVAYYVTGFAAFQLYNLVAYPVAFGYMVVVTLTGYALALRQNDALLSLIAAIGGLATPFLLYTDSGTITGLVIYTCLILLTIGAIYFWRGWQLLLWTGIIGGFFIFATILSTYRSDERLIVQLGVVGWFALAWLLPVVRSVLHHHRPLRWKASTFGIANETAIGILNYDVHLLTIVTPFIFFAFNGLIWLFDLERETAGALVLLFAGGFGAMTWWLTQQQSRLRDVHLFTTIALFTLSLLILFEGDWLFAALLAEMVVLHLAAARGQMRWLRFVAHVGMFVVGVALLYRITLTDVSAWATGLDVIGIAAVGSLSLVLVDSAEKRTYQLTAYIMFLGFLLAEFVGFTNGQAIVSILWGATALALLVWGIWKQQPFTRQVALVTLFVIVGKLLLIDFAEVDAVYRILLFFGFGVLFLLLSYGLWQRPARAK